MQPYLISWFRHDPAVVLSELTLPTLLVYGTTDIQVPVSDGERLRSMREDAELVVVEGMNHVLKQASGPVAAQMSSYDDPELPVMAGAITAVVEFIDRETPTTRAS